jgi:hypothetical protein
MPDIPDVGGVDGGVPHDGQFQAPQFAAMEQQFVDILLEGNPAAELAPGWPPPQNMPAVNVWNKTVLKKKKKEPVELLEINVKAKKWNDVTTMEDLLQFRKEGRYLRWNCRDLPYVEPLIPVNVYSFAQLKNKLNSGVQVHKEHKTVVYRPYMYPQADDTTACGCAFAKNIEDLKAQFEADPQKIPCSEGGALFFITDGDVNV